MNPAQVAQARTARLAAEATRPTYSTDTASAARKARVRMLIAADDCAGPEFCHVCGRVTDHRGEHSDEQLERFARSPKGKWLMETWN